MDLYYYIKKFKSKQISFDKILALVMDGDNPIIARNAKALIKNCDLTEDQWKLMFNLVRRDDYQSALLLMECKLDIFDRKAIIDHFLVENQYFSLYTLISQKNLNTSELAYVIRHLNVNTDDKKFIQLRNCIAGVFSLSADSDRIKLFNTLLKMPEFLTTILDYCQVPSNNLVAIFLEKEKVIIYEKYSNFLFNDVKRSLIRCYNYCVYFNNLISNKELTVLVNKIFRRQEFEIAEKLLKNRIFKFSKDLKDQLEALVLMKKLVE